MIRKTEIKKIGIPTSQKKNVTKNFVSLRISKLMS